MAGKAGGAGTAAGGVTIAVELLPDDDGPAGIGVAGLSGGGPSPAIDVAACSCGGPSAAISDCAGAGGVELVSAETTMPPAGAALALLPELPVHVDGRPKNPPTAGCDPPVQSVGLVTGTIDPM
jgi:hypothetical protein